MDKKKERQETMDTIEKICIKIAETKKDLDKIKKMKCTGIDGYINNGNFPYSERITIICQEDQETIKRHITEIWERKVEEHEKDVIEWGKTL